MKNYLKKLSALILALAMLFSLSACEDDPVNGYTGPWWTQTGGNSAHTGTLDTDGVELPSLSQLPAEVWKYQLKSALSIINSSLLVVEDNIFFGTSDGKVICMGDSTKKPYIKWTYQTENGITNSLCYKDGVVYCGGYDGFLYAFNAEDGSLVWFKYLNSAIADAPVLVNDTIVCGTLNGKVYSLKLENGTQIWDYSLTEGIATDIMYYDGGVEGGMVVFAAQDTYFHALNATTGKALWSVSTGTVNPQAPSAADGYVYLPSGEGIVYCVDAATGEKKWTFETENNVYIVGYPAIKDGKVIVGSFDGMIYCLDSKTGEKLWEYDTYYRITSPATIAGSYVLFGASHPTASTEYLYCLNFYTGEFVWCAYSATAIKVEPTVVNGAVYYTNNGGYIIKLSGEQKLEDVTD